MLFNKRLELVSLCILSSAILFCHTLSGQSHIRDRISLNGKWRMQEESPVKSDSYTIDGFENIASWKGRISVDDKFIKEGKSSGKWTGAGFKDIPEKLPTPYLNKICRKNIPHSWDNCSAMEFWCYSPEITNLLLVLALPSDDGSDNAWDYFRFDIRQDWKGWKKIKLETAEALKMHKPAGWTKIDEIQMFMVADSKTDFSKIKRDFSFYLDDMRMILDKSRNCEFVSFDGESGSYWSEKYDDGKWKYADVPMSGNVFMNGIHWLRKNFTLPQSAENKRIILKFERLSYVAWLWVNGKPVHSKYEVDGKYANAAWQGLITSSEYDITELVNFQTDNNITVKLFFPENVPAYPPFLLRGMGKADILLIPDLHIERVLITPDIDNGILDVRALINNSSTKDEKFSLTYNLSENGEAGGESGILVAEEKLPAGKEKEFSFKIKSDGKKIKLWSPSDPQLFDLTLALKKDGLVDFKTETFGWRKFEIRGNRFYLNNKSFFIRGYSHVGTNWGKDNTILEQARKANINLIRHHGAPFGEIYDITDKSGMLMISEGGSTPGAFWEKYGVEEYFRCYCREIPRWFYSQWNHPSIVMHSILNEPWKSPVKFLSGAYDIAKKTDPSRPVLTAAGGINYSLGGLTEKNYSNLRTDVDDVHCYHGWYEKPILFMRDWIDYYEKTYKGPTRPFMNTECVGRYTMTWNEAFVGSPWPRWLGSHVLKMEKQSPEIFKMTAQKQAEGIKPAVEMWRSRKGVVAGAWIFTWWIPHNFEIVKKSFSPVFVCATFDDKNYFDGDVATFDIHVINDEQKIMKDTSVIVRIVRAKDDKEIFSKSFQFEEIDADGIKTKKGDFCAAGWSEGTYRLDLVLSEEGREIFSNDYEFQVFPKTFKSMKIQSSKKVVLLDSNGKTAEILKSLGVSFARKTSFENYNMQDCEVLIVGANFANPVKSAEINNWVESGGRVLFLEQRDYENVKILFPKNFSLVHQYGPLNHPLYGQFNSFVDVIFPGHPVFNGLGKADFEDWNGNYHVLTNGLLQPYDKLKAYTLAQVRSSGHWNGASIPGSAMLDFSHGKGEYFFTQLLAVDRWGKDPVATKYLYNVFDYMLTKEQSPVAVYDAKQESLGVGPFNPDEKGFIHHWLICGPFPNPGGRPYHPREVAIKNQKGYELDPFIRMGGAVWVEKGEKDIEPIEGMTHIAVFPKTTEGYWGFNEKQEKECKWRAINSTGHAVSFSSLFAIAENVTGYAACYVESPEARKVKVKVGSDDGYKLWVNHKYIGGLCTFRDVVVDSESYDIELKKGLNPVMFKVVQDTVGMGFCLRFTDLSDKPLSDIKIWLVPNR